MTERKSRITLIQAASMPFSRRIASTRLMLMKYRSDIARTLYFSGSVMYRLYISVFTLSDVGSGGRNEGLPGNGWMTEGEKSVHGPRERGEVR